MTFDVIVQVELLENFVTAQVAAEIFLLQVDAVVVALECHGVEPSAADVAHFLVARAFFLVPFDLKIILRFIRLVLDDILRLCNVRPVV